MRTIETIRYGRSIITNRPAAYKSNHFEAEAGDRLRAVIMDAECRGFWYDAPEHRSTVRYNGKLDMIKGNRPSDLPYLAEARSMKELADILEPMPEYWAQISNIAFVWVSPEF